MNILKVSCLVLLLTVGFFACQQEQKEETKEEVEIKEETPETQNTEEMTESANNEAKATRGQVVSLGNSGKDGMKTIKVDHEEIPDFMMAMRMDLQVANTDAADLKEGDKISFEMVKMEEGGFKMQKIEKLPEDTELNLKKVE